MAESNNDSLLCLRAPQPYLGELADNWPELRARVLELTGTTIPEAWLESLESHYEILWKGVRQVRQPWPHHWLEPVALSLAGSAHRMLTLEETRLALEKAKKDSPALKAALEEANLPLITLYEVSRGLLRERVSIADTEGLLTTVVTNARFTRDVGSLIELVRTSMAPWISQRFERVPGCLDVVVLADEVSQVLAAGARLVHEGMFLEIDPALGRKTLEAIQQSFRRFGNDAPTQICLLVEPHLRPILARLCERAMPNLDVLSWNEIHTGTREEVQATVSF